MQQLNHLRLFAKAALLCGLILLFGCEAKVRPVQPEDAQALVKVARQLLDAEGEVADLGDDLPRRLTAGRTSNAVFVTLHRSNPGNPLRAGDQKDSILASLVSAVDKIKTGKKFKEFAADKMDRITIQVDIMADEPVQTERIGEGKKAQLDYELGFDGLLVQRYIKGENEPDRSFYFLPGDYYFHDLGSNAEQKVRKKIESYLITRVGVFVPGKTIYLKYKKFHTVAAAEAVPGDAANPLYRSNVLLPDTGRGYLLAAAYLSGADWLVSSVMENGVFRYEYKPLLDKMKRRYKSLNHADAVAALYEAYRETNRKSYLDAANDTAQFLKSNIAIYDVAENWAGFELGGKSSLGVNATTIMALLKKPEKSKTLRDRTMIASLGNLLVAMQVEDGRFYTYYHQLRAHKIPDGQARNFVGLALRALVGLYRNNKDEKWLAAAEKGFAKRLEENGEDKPLAGWTLIAGAELAEITGNEKYRSRIFAEADALADMQWKKDAPYVDFVGGFNNVTPPQTDSTALRAQMLNAAYSLALSVEDQARAEKYGTAVIGAAMFIAGQQYREQNSYYLANPQEAIGGFRENMISDRLRIDYTANSLVAIQNALEIIARRENKRYLEVGPTAVTQPEK
jgi:AMMECR1 domain-containing protein